MATVCATTATTVKSSLDHQVPKTKINSKLVLNTINTKIPMNDTKVCKQKKPISI